MTWIWAKDDMTLAFFSQTHENKWTRVNSIQRRMFQITHCRNDKVAFARTSVNKTGRRLTVVSLDADSTLLSTDRPRRLRIRSRRPLRCSVTPSETRHHRRRSLSDALRQCRESLRKLQDPQIVDLFIYVWSTIPWRSVCRRLQLLRHVEIYSDVMSARICLLSGILIKLLRTCLKKTFCWLSARYWRSNCRPFVDWTRFPVPCLNWADVPSSSFTGTRCSWTAGGFVSTRWQSAGSKRRHSLGDDRFPWRRRRRLAWRFRLRCHQWKLLS